MIIQHQLNDVSRYTLRKKHIEMNKWYHNMLYDKNESNKFSESDYVKFKKMETDWIESEKKQCLRKYDCHVIVSNQEIVESALNSHGASPHPIFDYLAAEASLDDLKIFINNESVLNLEFFDYLALAVIGVSDQAKSEIARNLWDEAGRGKISQSHTVLFEKFFNDIGMKYNRHEIISNMSYEGIAGINLFNYFAIYPYNKMKYFGMLAATEMLDPPHYNKLIKGISRLFKHHPVNQQYYVEHELVDVDHASGWLQHVVIPELSVNPHKTSDFWLGFYMRLDSVKNYYDDLYHVLTMNSAA